MRFIILHKTTAEWEAGAKPTGEMISRVGAMIGELSKAGRLLAGEGLAPSAQGARLTFSGGAPQIVRGPFDGSNELVAGFDIVRTRSLDEAIEWATRRAAGSDVAEIDIRPINEAWDIGIAPKPAGLDTRRYMVLRKATASTEARAASESPRTAFSPAAQSPAAPATAEHLGTVNMRPSRQGRRYTAARSSSRRQVLSAVDGPFAESKEMVGGYVIVSGTSLDDVDPWARKYIETVESHEVDVRQLDEP